MSSPLFELEVEGNPIVSAAVNKELKLLLEEGELSQEVNEYWFQVVGCRLHLY